MYALLAANRNFTCGKAFADIFPLSVLIKYIHGKNRVIDEVKSVLCKLLLSVYIDKEPRLLIQKPNLVRIFKPPREEIFGRGMINLIFDTEILALKRHPSHFNE